MRPLRVASAMWVVVGLSLASCDGDDDEPGSVTTHGARDGGGRGGRGGSDPDRDGGTSASGGRGGSSGGGTGATSGATGRDGGGGSGGEVDAGDPTKCAGVSCPAPSVCDREASVPTCVCPKGFHFSDLGDDESPCQPDCNDRDCDAG